MILNPIRAKQALRAAENFAKENGWDLEDLPFRCVRNEEPYEATLFLADGSFSKYEVVGKGSYSWVFTAPTGKEFSVGVEYDL